jgi:formylmethanofuran dehydrogenase subunit E
MEVNNMDIFNQVRCESCGEFYHVDATKGGKCYSCSEDSEEDYNEYYSDDEVE